MGLFARRGGANRVGDGVPGGGLGQLHMTLCAGKGRNEHQKVYDARVQLRLDIWEMCAWQQRLFKDNFPHRFAAHMHALGDNIFNLGDAISDADVTAIRGRGVPGLESFERKDMRAFNVAATIRNPPETVTREHSDDNTVGEDADGNEVSCYQPVDI